MKKSVRKAKQRVRSRGHTGTVNGAVAGGRRLLPPNGIIAISGQPAVSN